MRVQRPNSEARESIRFANDGGPLIVLSRDLLAHWRGSKGPYRQASKDSDDDYERACAAAYPAETIRVGTGFGLVIGSQDQVCPVNWLRLAGQAAPLLVGWSYADEGAAAELYAHLQSGGPQWRRDRHTMRVTNDELVLLHAASAGNEINETITGREFAVIGDAIVSHVPSGDYAVESSPIGGDLKRDRIGCVVVRWVPL